MSIPEDNITGKGGPEADLTVSRPPAQDVEVPRQRPRWLRICIDNILIIFIIAGVIIGIVLGLSLRSVWKYNEYRKIYYMEFPGRLLLNMLKLLILPLIVSSLVAGMADLGAHATGKLGGAAMLYYMTTTLMAVIEGIVLVVTIHPGHPHARETLTKKSGKQVHADAVGAILDLISQCFPDNIVTACFYRVVTVFPQENRTVNGTSVLLPMPPKLVTQDGSNVLGLVVFSMALGCAINYVGEAGKPLLAFFEALNSATMILVNLVIWYTPIGLIFLVASKFISTASIPSILGDLGMYMTTILSGLALHGFFVLPVLYMLCTRKSPTTFAFNMGKALSTAWGTASSSATLPLTMECLVDKSKLNINIVRFVAPVGATINMDGTALYEAVACIFIAQVNDKDMTAVDIIIISLTATAAAVGAAGIPQAGLVTMVIVLTAVGLPTEDITLILSVDWFLDRFRTVINVWGDAIGAGILDHIFRNSFRNVTEPDQVEDVKPTDVPDVSNIQLEEHSRQGEISTTSKFEQDSLIL